MTTEEDRQEERDRLGNDPSLPSTEQLEEENPLESPAEAKDPDTAPERPERDEEPERPRHDRIEENPVPDRDSEPDAQPIEQEQQVREEVERQRETTPTTTGAQPEQPADDQQAG